MKTIKNYLFLLTLAVMCSTVTYAEEVVKDTLGTTISSAKTVESLLQGQVAGVRVWSTDGSPMAAQGISIRGVNSIRGGHQPLYVVDGTILNGSNTRNIDPLWQYPEEGYINPLSQLGFLAPSEIESIQVLKNTSATALYGSKGANGVVIITTKKITDNKPTIVWNSNVDYSTPSIKGYAKNAFSHNHNIMVGNYKNNAGYTLSAYLRDDNYVLPGTGSMKGGLRTTIETKANPVVWFGLNSNLSVGKTAMESTSTMYGNESLTTLMRNNPEAVQAYADDYDDNTMEYRAVNSMWLKLNIFKGFSFDIDLGTDYQYSTRALWWGNGTAVGAANNGAAAMLKTSSFAYNAAGKLNYKYDFENGHHLHLAAGVEALGNRDVLNTQNGTDFYNHALRAKGLNIAASKAKHHSFHLNQFTVGTFAQIDWNWKDIVGAQGAVRAEHTPKYGYRANVTYPSISAFWDLSNAFFKDAEDVSSLRIEAGYGHSGLQDAIPYELFGQYTAGEYYQSPDNAWAFFDGRNAILTKEWNISLSAGFLNDRLNVELGYYNRNTIDRLFLYSLGEQFTVSPDGIVRDEELDEEIDTSNLTQYWDYTCRKQIASHSSVITNKGIEFAVSAIPVQSKDWNWTINLNGAFNNNTMTRVAKEDKGDVSLGGGLTVTENKIGSQVNSLCAGNPIPKFNGGISTALRWKDLTFDMLADCAAGFDILNLNAMAADKATAISTKYIEKGDFLRLARVALSYNIPVKNVKWMQSFKVFASANNLAVATGYSGWTPDVNSFAATNYLFGIDNGSCPAAKSFVLGLSIKF